MIPTRLIAARLALLATLALSWPLFAGQAPDNQKVIAGNGRSAMDCVRLVKIASDDSRLSGGGAVLSNGCEDRVDVTWCYADGECQRGLGNLWTINPGYSWPVSATREIRWAACHGANTVSFEKGTAGLRAICTAPDDTRPANGLPVRAPNDLTATFDKAIVEAEGRAVAREDAEYQKEIARAVAAGKAERARMDAAAASAAEPPTTGGAGRPSPAIRPTPAPNTVTRNPPARSCISLLTDLVNVINQGNPFAEGQRLYAQGQAQQSLQWEQEMWSQQILVRTANAMTVCSDGDRMLVVNGMRDRQERCRAAASSDRRTVDCLVGRNYGNDETRINAAVQDLVREGNSSGAPSTQSIVTTSACNDAAKAYTEQMSAKIQALPSTDVVGQLRSAIAMYDGLVTIYERCLPDPAVQKTIDGLKSNRAQTLQTCRQLSSVPANCVGSPF